MSQTATLVYSALPVPPQGQTQLNPAVSGVTLDPTAIEDATGAHLLSDTTANVGGSEVTRTLVFSLSVPVAQQFNGNNPLPSSSGIEQWYVVTTTGVNASIGELIYDSGTGVLAVIAASDSNSIVPLVPFTGGTISFPNAGHLYAWTGSAWTDEGVSPGGAFQANFPPGSDQTAPFNNLYKDALGGQLGSVVTASDVVIA